MDRALNFLNALVKSGVSAHDAETRTAERFNLLTDDKLQQLRDAYDEQDI